MKKDLKIKRKYLSEYCNLVDEVINLAQCEARNIETGTQTLWTADWLESVLTEFKQLKIFAQQGRVYFEYGTKQTMLSATYLMIDTNCSTDYNLVRDS